MTGDDPDAADPGAKAATDDAQTTHLPVTEDATRALPAAAPVEAATRVIDAKPRAEVTQAMQPPGELDAATRVLAGPPLEPVAAPPEPAAPPPEPVTPAEKPVAPPEVVGPPPEPAAAGAPAAPPAPPLWTSRGARIGAAAFVVLAALAAVAFGVRHIVVLRIARDRARTFGVEIGSASVQGFGLRDIDLADVEFTLDGVAGLRGKADRLQVSTEGHAIARVTATGLTITIAGDPPAALDSLAVWSRAHPTLFASEVRATVTSVEVRTADAAAPWFSAKRGKVVTDANGVRLDAESSSIIGFTAGPVLATWNKDGTRATIALGADRARAPAVRVEVRPKGATTDIEATLAKAPLGDLASRLHADARAAISGHATATLRRGGGFDGAANATLDGWVPPHDKDADGIIYGNETRVSANFRAPPQATELTLDVVTLEVGGLKLRGPGSISRNGPRVKLELTGSIPCSQMARSAAANYGPLGAFVSDLAGGHVEGSVGVGIHVEGDVHDPKTFKPKPSVRPACHLR